MRSWISYGYVHHLPTSSFPSSLWLLPWSICLHLCLSVCLTLTLSYLSGCSASPDLKRQSLFAFKVPAMLLLIVCLSLLFALSSQGQILAHYMVMGLCPNKARSEGCLTSAFFSINLLLLSYTQVHRVFSSQLHSF